MMREIVLDTETTGRDPATGDRVVEVACLELFNHLPTGEVFQRYTNPERGMPEEAYRVHGLSAEFLSQHPVFGGVVDDFLEFIGDSKLIIHNARFDLAFLNAELKALDLPALPPSRAVDTLELARRKFPGARNSLDALCRRFSIDNSARTVHGALLDTELLAEVYLELIGGRQPGLGLARATLKRTARETEIRPPRAHAPSGDELAAHVNFLETLDKPVWSR